ncbi:hypothetical protein [Kitasatospora sp. NPDC088134]|uniref:hypothetical protein n=1 Tax=Kitasatospora sp. NPDC088134 TaxID=3364071 RepID=UPI00382850CF
MKLRALFEETGWTGQAFAQAVNAEALRSALELHFDRTTVAHWLAGSRPRGQVGEFICRVLSQRLQRDVQLEHIGLAGPSTAEVGSPAAGARERLRELAREGLVAQRVLRRLPYSPTTGFPEAESGRAPAGGTGRLSLTHVRSAESMVALFAHADETFGGARWRPALASYLSVDIAERLGGSASSSVGRRFRQAGGDLAYLAGFMAFDENLHGVAQAYFQLAVQLSSETGDRGRYAIAVRQMSVQAHQLGNVRLALQFAEESSRGVPCLPDETGAFVLGQEALALAGAGERRRALEVLGRAQRLLDRADGREALLGGYHLAAFSHQQAEVLAAAGDLPAACGALAASLRLRPPQERRARMLTTARLACLQLSQGQVELACSTWEGFLDDYPLVASARGDVAFRELRRRLRSYQREPAARRLLARAGRVAGVGGGRPTAGPRVPPARSAPPG